MSISVHLHPIRTFTLPVVLAIDIGNTRIKWARFNQREVIETGIIPDYTENSIPALLLLHPSDSICISSVVHIEDHYLKLFKEKQVLLVDHSTPIPVSNSYKTPETLGIDRLCAAIGARSLFPGHPILAIDIGTCLTFEFVTRDGEYCGGNISPGLHMRFAALGRFTSKLPKLAPGHIEGPIGGSTNEAMRLGVQQGMLFEIGAMIATMKALHPDLKTVATGGDLPFFVNDLKTHIFADLLLVLRGINEIYLHNT